MTIKELSQLYHLNPEIEREQARLQELEDFARGVTSKITGMPHVAGVSDKTGIAAEIADCKAGIEARIKLCVIEYKRLRRYIEDVDDSCLRQALSLRYVNGLSWRQVAASIGPGYTADAVRMAVKRFIGE